MYRIQNLPRTTCRTPSEPPAPPDWVVKLAWYKPTDPASSSTITRPSSGAASLQPAAGSASNEPVGPAAASSSSTTFTTQPSSKTVAPTSTLSCSSAPAPLKISRRLKSKTTPSVASATSASSGLSAAPVLRDPQRLSKSFLAKALANGHLPGANRSLPVQTRPYYFWDPARFTAIISKAWDPIFGKYKNSPEPDWQAFRARFGRYIKHSPLDLQPITGAELQKAASKQSGAVGTEGWRADESARLPLWLFDQLACALDLVETLGRWPQSLTKALCSLIPKDTDLNGPLDLRPITIMPILYRTWGAARINSLLRWQEAWIHQGAKGFCTGCGTEDIYWTLAARIEKPFWRMKTCLESRLIL